MSPSHLAPLALAVSLGAGLAHAPRPDTPLVRIPVSVEDGLGRPVKGIEPGEFTLFIDNVPAPIVDVAAELQSLRLILIVDVTTRPPLSAGLLREAIDQVAGAMRDGDRAHVWRVGGRITRGPAFTREAISRRTAAGFAANPANLERSGPSPIWDAIVEASEALETGEGRRAILLYTDGRASGNRHGAADVATRALAAGVSVSVVAPQTTTTFRNDDRMITVHPDRMPQAIARDTGGVFFHFPQGRRSRDDGPPPSLGATFAGIMTSLRHEYVLTVARPDGPGPHLIGVRVNRPGLTLRARRVI
jgi:hypothetical protein